jgi:hypothetical protein
MMRIRRGFPPCLIQAIRSLYASTKIWIDLSNQLGRNLIEIITCPFASICSATQPFILKYHLQSHLKFLKCH